MQSLRFGNYSEKADYGQVFSMQAITFAVNERKTDMFQIVLATGVDASSIVSSATSAFGLVQDFVILAVTFFIIVKIVKWIRK